MIRLLVILRRSSRPALTWPATALAVLLSLLAGLVAGCMAFKQPALGRRSLVLLAVGCAGLALGLYPLMQGLLFPQLRRLRPFARLSAVAAALLFGFYLLTFSPWPLTSLPLLPAQLEVNGTGGRIELLGFEGDGHFVSYNSFRQSGDWQRAGATFFAQADAPASFNWQGRVRDAELVFQAGPDGGVVRVTWNDQTTSYDLYSPTLKELRIHTLLTPPAWEAAMIALLGGLIGFGTLLIAGLLLSVFPETTAPPITKGSIRKTQARLSLESHWLRKRLGERLAIALLGALTFLLVTRTFGLWLGTDFE